MFSKHGRNAEVGSGDVRRRIADARELDADAIGRLIVDAALRRTLVELERRRHLEARSGAGLEELT